MGASGWHYFVPFQPDLEQALQDLRQSVFERGEYLKPEEFYGTILDQQWPELPDEASEELRRWIAQRKSLPPPRTIAELLERNGEDGTHSILDIHRVTEQPDVDAAWLVGDIELHAIFGTTRPTHEQVMEKERAGALWRLRRRWDGMIIIVYEGGEAREIFFSGFSGD